MHDRIQKQQYFSECSSFIVLYKQRRNTGGTFTFGMLAAKVSFKVNAPKYNCWMNSFDLYMRIRAADIVLLSSHMQTSNRVLCKHREIKVCFFMWRAVRPNIPKNVIQMKHNPRVERPNPKKKKRCSDMRGTGSSRPAKMSHCHNLHQQSRSFIPSIGDMMHVKLM